MTPTSLTPTSTPTITPTPTLTATPTPTLTATPTPEEEFCLYTVRPNDKLLLIAERFTGNRENYTEIKNFNDLTSDIIRIGQELKIPKSLLLEEYQTCELQAPLSLGDLVWHDLDNDGKFEPEHGETGIAHVTVQLYDAGDKPAVDDPVASVKTGKRPISLSRT